MTYCVIENTATDAWQCVAKLEDLVQNGEEINEYEQKRLKSLIEACRQIVSLYEEGVENDIIDENGALIDADNDDDDEHPYLDRHEDKE
jgi:hypothetical protein